MPTVRIYRDGSPVREYAKVSSDDNARLSRILASLSRLQFLHPHMAWTVKVDGCRDVLLAAPPRVGGYRGSTSHLELKV